MRSRGEVCSGLAFVLVLLLAPGFCVAADQQDLSKEQIEHFLLTAKVVNIRHSSKGITDTLRLTLSDGTITHDASLQAIDEHKTEMTLADGRRELLFVDSYKYNIAAYRLAELLGLDDIVPVYVERKWQAQTGSLSWWLPVQMDEAERLKRKIPPPDDDTWNKQMYKVRVLDELVYDTDPNLILKTFDKNELARRTKGYLNKDGVVAVMARRDKIVTYFQKLIAESGENEVLY